MTFDPTRKQLAFVLPESFRKAEVIFQKQGEELQLSVQPTTRSRQVVSTQHLSSGLWNVVLNWWDGQRHYWAKHEILIG